MDSSDCILYESDRCRVEHIFSFKKEKVFTSNTIVKRKIVIGYGYKEVSQIAYQFFQENMLEIYYQYAGLILRDIEVYYGSVENFIEEE